AWNPRFNRLLIFLANRSWSVFNLDTGMPGPIVPGPISWIAWDATGERIAAPSIADASVQLYDDRWLQPVGRVMRTKRAGGLITWFSHKGDLLLTNDWSQMRRVWDPEGGSELLSIPAMDEVSGFTFDADDGHIAASSNGKTVQIWQVAPGTEERIILGQSEEFESSYYRFQS